MIFEIECQCAGEPLSPGQSGCMPMAGRDKLPIFMHYKDSTGALNGVPAGTVINQAYVTAKLNSTDLTQRWYVFPEMFNLAEPVATMETEDIDGIAFPTGEEIKQPITWEHVKEDANPALKAAYDSLKCNEIGVIFITYKGQLNGMNDGSGNLVSIKLQNETLSAQYAAPVKGSVQKMMCSMLIDELENEANRDYIASNSISYSTKNWFSIQPLQVIPIEISNADQDTIVFTLDGLYGGVDRKKPIEGIVSADISPDNGVTPATVTNFTQSTTVGATIVESSSIPGQYTMTLASPQAYLDFIHIDLFKSGYKMRTFIVELTTS
jgi:hypothetical protein